MEPKKIKKVVIREDLVAITGDYKKAVILGQFIYWADRVADADKFIQKENVSIAKYFGLFTLFNVLFLAANIILWLVIK